MLLIILSLFTNAQIRITYGGDTLKGNIKRMTECSYYNGDYYKKTVYTFEEGQKLEMASFYAHDNQDKYMGKWLVKFDSHKHIMETRLFCSDDSPCKSETYTYDNNGRETSQYQVQHLNTTHSDHSDCNRLIDWLWGGDTEWIMEIDSSVDIYKNEYDSMGRLVLYTIESLLIRTQYTDTTIETTCYKYCSNSDRVSNMKKETVRINQNNTDTIIEITNYKYDNIGNKEEENEIKKTTNSISIDSMKTLYTYDAKNNLIEVKSYFKAFDYSSQPHSGKMVGAGDKYTYDNLNNMSSDTSYHIYRQDDGSETKVVATSHQIDKLKKTQKEYDKQGNIIKISEQTFVTLTRQIEYY